MLRRPPEAPPPSVVDAAAAAEEEGGVGQPLKFAPGQMLLVRAGEAEPSPEPVP